jgi:hypothetical protein
MQYRTNKKINLTWGVWAFKPFTVRKGAKVEVATNQPLDSQGRPQYWLAGGYPRKLWADPYFRSEAENVGWLIPADSVEQSHDFYAESLLRKAWTSRRFTWKEAARISNLPR